VGIAEHSATMSLLLALAGSGGGNGNCGGSGGGGFASAAAVEGSSLRHLSTAGTYTRPLLDST
jgi:hypothetical protein